jgi:hypothetical protein
MPPLLEAHLPTNDSPVSPHESLSPFLATLPKSLSFKSFPSHTSEIPPGGPHNWLTRNLESELHPARRERSPRVSPRSSFLHGSQTGSALRSNPTTPLSFHALTNCKFSNSFVLTFIQNGGGVPPSPLFQRFKVHRPRPHPNALKLSSFFTLSTVNCQLLTNLSPTSHQSRVTNNDPATHL